MTVCAAPRHGEPEPAEPHAYLCRPCRTGLRADLLRLPGLHDALGELLDPLGSGGSGGSGDGLPFHEKASEHASQIRHDVAWWCRELATVTGTDPLPVLPLAESCAWLAGQVRWVRYRPFAPDMAATFASDRGRANALRDPWPRAEIPIPAGRNHCPRCGAPGLLSAVVYTMPGDQRASLVICGGCGHDWDATQWLKLGRDIIRTMEAA